MLVRFLYDWGKFANFEQKAFVFLNQTMFWVLKKHLNETFILRIQTYFNRERVGEKENVSESVRASERERGERGGGRGGRRG